MPSDSPSTETQSTGTEAGDTTIAFANDHAATSYREPLMKAVEDAGFTVLDLGTAATESVDYPDYANAMANALKSGVATRGVLICGTGIGISIAANRHRHVRAALCHSTTDARLSRQHNDANVLVMGARTLGPEQALDCLSTFLETAFEGGRHARRVGKMS